MITKGNGYARRIAATATNVQNYEDENWDDAFSIANEADKRIAELEGELEKHQWISVEDRLPEVPQGRDSIQVEFYDVKKNHVGIICLIKDGNNDWIKAYSVTHFRYITLPERKGE